MKVEQWDVAFGANLEARLRDKDFPFGQALSTLGMSLMKWRNDLALGANLQSQFPVGRNSKMAVRVGLNNKFTGQITVRTSTSEQLQIALAGIIPLAISIYRSIASNVQVENLKSLGTCSIDFWNICLFGLCSSI
ncbi:hypothetical protein M5K25_014807 [Dendrobium thyrsiflorum]|uniref:Translocase of chloroplast 159/132 membrane anchor domain-containing protein n=1 Tax=Dendrobium thyrsiflorum TaxID=117978 RepID=A0ABD0UP49_DENTH